MKIKNEKMKRLFIILLIVNFLLLMVFSFVIAGDVPSKCVVQRFVDDKAWEIQHDFPAEKDSIHKITYKVETSGSTLCYIAEDIDSGECSFESTTQEGVTITNQKSLTILKLKQDININIKVSGGCSITGNYRGGVSGQDWNDPLYGAGILKTASFSLQEAIAEAEQCEKNNGVCREDKGKTETSCNSGEAQTDKFKCSSQGGKSRVCCLSNTCELNGGHKTTRDKEQEECAQPTVLVPANDLKENELCCESKEKQRETVKRPGTLGRLNSCFGKYLIWQTAGEQKTQSLNDTLKILTDAATKYSSVYSAAECDLSISSKNILDLWTEIKDSTSTPAQQSEKIKSIDSELLACRNKIANKITKDMSADLKGQYQEAQQQIEKAQDNLEKTREIFVMSWTEGIANMISCAQGWTYASKLAYGDYWVGAGGAFLGGLAGNLLFKNSDVPGLIGTMVGGAAGSFGHPADLGKEMGSCASEQPIKGSELCSTCNEDPYRLCTKERCGILGNCIPVPTAKGDQVVCIPGKCEEVGMPTFTQGKVEWYVDTDLNGSQALGIQGGNIRTRINDGKVIPFNTKTIMINVTTDKPAKCRYVLDKTGASFSEMTDFEENEFPAIPGGKAGSQATHIILSGIITRNIEHTIFIKCQNSCGVEPNASYDQNIVTFKLEQKPDQLPPNIIYVDPASGSMIRSDLQTIDASFWLDEKGNCRFADASTNYSAFNYTRMIPFGTYNNPNSSVISGSCDNSKPCLDRNDTCARCTLKLDLSKGYELTNYTGTEFNTTKTYHLIIRCNDQRNNVMTADDALDYILMTVPGYNINFTQPPEDNMFTYDVHPEIQVTSETRQTQCKYKVYNLTSTQPNPRWEDMTFIDSETSTIHTGRINETLDADPGQGHGYTIAALCRDKFNMEARAWRTLFIVEDVASPILIRTYHDSITGDFLVIETDEPSLCTYSFDSCNFNFSQGILMTGNTEIHGTYWKDKTYFIKCVDEWGNYPSSSGGTKNPAENYCTATLKPFEIPKLLL